MNILFDVQKDSGYPSKYPLEAVSALRSMASYVENILSVLSAEIKEEEREGRGIILICVLEATKYISIIGYSDPLTTKINHHLSSIDKSELWSQADAVYWARLS